jgi:hypothetical protein
MEHIAQGKRSGTLGLRVLEQSRPERAKALQRALDFYWITNIKRISNIKRTSNIKGYHIALLSCISEHL